MQGDIGADDSPEQYLADMQSEIDRQKHRYGLIFDVDLAPALRRGLGRHLPGAH